MEITRRSFGLAALGGALLPALPAGSKEPPAGAQVPSVYRMKVGTYEVTVLNDGWLPIKVEMFSGDQAAAEKAMQAAFCRKMWGRPSQPMAYQYWRQARSGRYGHV